MMDLPLLVRPGVYQKAISGCPRVAAVPTHRNHSRRAKVCTVAVKGYLLAGSWRLHAGAAHFSVWQLILSIPDQRRIPLEYPLR
jgi:hypothetical protein